MNTTARTCVVGDVHGHSARLAELLRAAGLIDAELRWQGGTARLWCMGDFFDRGPDGIGAVDLVMALQPQAAAAGGSVASVLGNHDFFLLAVLRFGRREADGLGHALISSWLRNGGTPLDLDRMTAAHMEWLTSLPALARVEGRLLAHADALFYLKYGRSVEAVNAVFARALHSDDVDDWLALLEDFNARDAFLGGDGQVAARSLLDVYGCRQLIHGHSPICRATGQPPETVTGPLVYAGCLCINLDHGLYLGGPGFVYELPPG